MLLIIDGPRSTRTHYWHFGEPVPRITNRVIIFHADGDELDLILRAMKSTREERSNKEIKS